MHHLKIIIIVQYKLVIIYIVIYLFNIRKPHHEVLCRDIYLHKSYLNLTVTDLTNCCDVPIIMCS